MGSSVTTNLRFYLENNNEKTYKKIHIKRHNDKIKNTIKKINTFSMTIINVIQNGSCGHVLYRFSSTYLP